MNTFFGDVRWAFRSWGGRLWFVAFTLLLACAAAAAYSNRRTSLIGALIVLFYVGFFGTQRIWYLRAYRNEQFEGRDVWRFTRSFFAQFLGLDLLCAIPTLLVIVLWFALQAHNHPGQSAGPIPLGVTLSILGINILLDIGLTFVMPTLAFSTNSATNALRTGVKMIGQTWPSCCWYVLAPGITLSIGSLLVSTHALGGWARPILVVIGAMVAFLFRGAVVPFYLRLHPEVGRNGSVDEKLSSRAEASVAAGWYPDPAGAGSRWWDGSNWTEMKK
jgi:Protein of unknown function (DUF2510)